MGNRVENTDERSDDYTDRQTFKPGDRVELHPGCDLWMRGARFATVDRAAGSIVWVTVDKLTFRPMRWFHRESLRHVR